MTRVSSAMINANALTYLNKAQQEMVEAQRQSATQKEANDLKGYGATSKSIVTLDRIRAKSEAHMEVANEVTIRLTLQDSYLQRVGDTVGDLKTKLTEALSLRDLSTVEQLVSDSFTDIRSALNATHNGQYLFSGTASNEEAMTANSLTDLAANPVADALNADGNALRVQVSEYQTINAGPRASDFAGEIMTALRDLKTFIDGATGPFTDNPDAAQEAAIHAALSSLDTGFNDVLAAQASNGSAMESTDRAIERQTTETNLLENLTAEMTDVDLAEVAVKLNQAQIQYQASASIFNRIQSLSLVDYLR